MGGTGQAPGVEPSPTTVAGVALTRRNAKNLALMVLALTRPSNIVLLARNLTALMRSDPWRDYVARRAVLGLPDAREQSAARALEWICRSQDCVGSGGVGDYQFHGWTPGYPEVTGYIIPTIWDYSGKLGRDDLAQRAVRMADWELGIQKPGGGFESWYEGENRPPVVFNTGQVIRGLTRTYDETRDERYLDAAVRAGDWIVANQDADGTWAKAGYLGMKVTYDTFVAAPLARLAKLTADEAYARAALANCEFALRHQLENGWFDLCDNTPWGHATPSTHTLCYTIDGLIETGEALGEERLIVAGERSARALLTRVDASGKLPGRFDREWRPAALYTVVTGSAQLGVILEKLHRWRPDGQLLDASRRLLDFLAFVQELNGLGDDRRGGLPGSFPIWGRYVPLKHASWATKFFLDHLLLSEKAVDPDEARATRTR
jgi:hypothetical protein